MCRRFLFVTALIVLLATGTDARAQSSFRVSGGGIVPTAPHLFSDASAPGAKVEIGPVFTLTNRLDLSVSVAHGRVPIASAGLLDAEAMTNWSLSGRLLIDLLPVSSMIQPYVTAGGGLHRLNHTPERDGVVCLAQWSPAALPCPPPYVTGRDDPEVRLGLQGGLGTAVSLTPKLRLFAESTYTGLLSNQENLQYVPLQFGFHFHPTR